MLGRELVLKTVSWSKSHFTLLFIDILLKQTSKWVFALQAKGVTNCMNIAAYQLRNYKRLLCKKIQVSVCLQQFIHSRWTWLHITLKRPFFHFGANIIDTPSFYWQSKFLLTVQVTAVHLRSVFSVQLVTHSLTHLLYHS